MIQIKLKCTAGAEPECVEYCMTEPTRAKGLEMVPFNFTDQNSCLYGRTSHRKFISHLKLSPFWKIQELTSPMKCTGTYVSDKKHTHDAQTPSSHLNIKSICKSHHLEVTSVLCIKWDAEYTELMLMFEMRTEHAIWILLGQENDPFLVLQHTHVSQLTWTVTYATHSKTENQSICSLCWQKWCPTILIHLQ